MPPDEIKVRFDVCPEQLRVSLNAVCDEAAALAPHIDGILTQTFEGTIDKSMLLPELAAEIDVTVTQGELESAVGTYTGDGAESQFINLGFTPKAVFAVLQGTEFQEGYLRRSALALQNSAADAYGHTALTIVSNGFRAYYSEANTSYRMLLNYSGQKYNYIAFR